MFKDKFTIANLLKAAVLTVIAFGLSFVLMQPFSLSLAMLISSNDRHDFSITDFYNIAADSREVRELDSDIVLVDISDVTREEVAYLLDALPEFEPRAVGLDVMFDVPHDDDSLLLAAIAKLPDMVMIVDVEPDKERGANTFHIGQTSFFYDSIGHRSYGASNLPTKYAGGVVREFPVEFKMGDLTPPNNNIIPSFSVALAEKIDSASVAELKARGKMNENINYPSRNFVIIPWDEIASYAEDLRGHVVLIGAVNSDDDMHLTPVQRKMSGLEIHAMALSTIINRNYLDNVGKWGDMLIAFFLCYVLAFIHVALPLEFKALALRILQLILVCGIVYVGYYFFVEENLVVNFSYSLLMMAFILFACDIWFGSIGLYKAYRRNRKNRITSLDNEALTSDKTDDNETLTSDKTNDNE